MANLQNLLMGFSVVFTLQRLAVCVLGAILGFVFDSSEVDNEMAALGNIAAQYALALDCGATDPATELPKFLDALEQAGMQKYLEAANAQLAAYLGN